MPISTVARIVPGKSFGFIKGLGQDEDYFFHRDDLDYKWDHLLHELENQPQVNVQFEVIQTAKGLRAQNVRRV